jgi:hypothetical protein
MAQIARAQLDQLISRWIAEWAAAGVFRRLRVSTPASFSEMTEVSLALATAAMDTPEALSTFPCGQELRRRVQAALAPADEAIYSDQQAMEHARTGIAGVQRVTGAAFPDALRISSDARDGELVTASLTKWMDAQASRLPPEHQAALLFLDEQFYALRDSFEVAGWVAWVYFDHLGVGDPWHPFFELQRHGVKVLLAPEECRIFRAR